MTPAGTPRIDEELAGLGFAAYGSPVAIDAGAAIIGAERISIGSHVRIDAFTLLSAGAGGMVIGDHVHIAAHCFVAGSAPIVLGDFVGLSVRTTVLSATDDFTGGALTGPTVPDHLRRVDAAPVVFEDHAVVGAGAVILPGVTVGEGAAVGALTLVKHDVEPWTVVAGPRAEPIGVRRRNALTHARELDR